MQVEACYPPGSMSQCVEMVTTISGADDDRRTPYGGLHPPGEVPQVGALGFVTFPVLSPKDCCVAEWGLYFEQDLVQAALLSA
jgi:hypothetical protein